MAKTVLAIVAVQTLAAYAAPVSLSNDARSSVEVSRNSKYAQEIQADEMQSFRPADAIQQTSFGTISAPRVKLGQQNANAMISDLLQKRNYKSQTQKEAAGKPLYSNSLSDAFLKESMKTAQSGTFGKVPGQSTEHKEAGQAQRSEDTACGRKSESARREE